MANKQDPIHYLQSADPILATVIQQVILPPLVPSDSYFEALTESIISQQLSIKAADTIYGRFKKLFKNERINAEEVLKLSDEKIRACGISLSKIKYIKDLAEKTLESGILFEQFEMMTDQEIIDELVKVKGIGIWTAQMFLMFTMGREDVFSYGDLGLRRAIEKLYKLKKEPSEKQAEKIADKWKPYRTIACRYLWKSLEL